MAPLPPTTAPASFPPEGGFWVFPDQATKELTKAELKEKLERHGLSALSMQRAQHIEW